MFGAAQANFWAVGTTDNGITRQVPTGMTAMILAIGTTILLSLLYRPAGASTRSRLTEACCCAILPGSVSHSARRGEHSDSHRLIPTQGSYTQGSDTEVPPK